MPEKVFEPQLPHGLERLAFRAPIWLYRLGLGWLLGDRFLKLTHTGRKSGLPRQTVLEVVKHDRPENIYYVASGWGEKSDWYRNVMANPQVTIQVGNRRWEARAGRLPPDEAEQVMLDYARRHPLALRELARVMGYRLDGTPEDARLLGRMVPIISLRPV